MDSVGWILDLWLGEHVLILDGEVVMAEIERLGHHLGVNWVGTHDLVELILVDALQATTYTPERNTLDARLRLLLLRIELGHVVQCQIKFLRLHHVPPGFVSILLRHSRQKVIFYQNLFI